MDVAICGYCHVVDFRAVLQMSKLPVMQANIVS
jgi:hypothetical protein